MSSFFESPEFLEQAAAGRVVHTPGMADEVMREMAPFLKAEGIDIDDPNADFTEAEFNAAMEKAQAQYNHRLFTPVGAHRGLALAELRAFALTVAHGDNEGASALASALPSDPEDFAPSVAQVTGAAMGLVDEWFTGETYGPKLGGVMAPKWQAKKSRAVARDILALAPKGRVVDSLDRLIISNGGQAVLEGSMLAVTAAVMRLSRANKMPATDVVVELMPLDGYPEPVAGTYGSAPAGVGDTTPEAAADIEERMNEVEKIVHEMPLSQRFHEWLAEELDDPDEDSEIFDSAHLLFCIAVSAGISLEEPEGVISLLDVLESFGADGRGGDDDDDADRSTGIFLDSMEALDDYLHFRMDTDDDPERWHEAHTLTEAASMQSDPLPAALLHVIETSGLSPERLAAPLPDSRLVEGVTGLLEWIGEARPITGTGRVKRADIAEAAAKLHINAVGVASNSRYEDGVNYARSADEVPILEELWIVMQLADVIEVSGTKVRPGPAADSWRDGAVPAETALPLIGAFLHEYLGGAVSGVRDSLAPAAVVSLAQHIIEILAPGEAPERPDLQLGEYPSERIDWLVNDVSDGLIAAGIAERAADGTMTVPAHFHRVLAGAAVMLLSGR